MFRFIALAMIVGLMAPLLVGCDSALFGPGVRGSGVMATRDFDVAGYDAVNASSAFKVTLVPGDNYGASITADDNLIDYVTVEKKGNTLVVGFDSKRLPAFSSTRQEATVTLPTLHAVSLSGASTASMDGFPAVEDFKADLSGASKLNGRVDASSIALDASGASALNLMGTGVNLVADGNGASSLQLGDLPVATANIKLSGGSTATVEVATKLDYDLAGGSDLTYGGGPQIGVSQTTGGSRASGK